MFKHIEVTRKATETAMQTKAASDNVDYIKNVEEVVAELIRKASELGRSCTIVSITSTITPHVPRLVDDLRKQGYIVGITSSNLAIIW